METLGGKFGLNIIKVDAQKRFMDKLVGLSDPETKRKIIGNEFVYVFDDEANKLEGVDFLAQGTLYTDVIESGTDTAQTIKSHHNVGGLPEDMQFQLIEPLNTLFKDEVRALGTQLGMPDEIVWRQPFPGPGLAIRVLGDLTEEKLETVRESDAILREEIAAAGLERDVWQYFTVNTDVKSVGVMGDQRTYDYTLAIRAITSIDGMTADFAQLPWDLLQKSQNVSLMRWTTSTVSSMILRANHQQLLSGNRIKNFKTSTHCSIALFPKRLRNINQFYRFESAYT